MRCAAITLSDVKALHPALAAYTDALLMGMIDSTLEFVFGSLGHTFGQVLRIWYIGAGAVVTVEVTATAVVLTVDGAATTLLFADYPVVADLILAIENLDDWEADPVIDTLLGQASDYLRTVSATVITSGYENRLVLCTFYRRECHFGRGESHLFLDFPIHSIASVTEDGEVLTADDYWIDYRGWLIRKGCAGGVYYPYSKDVWSMKEINNVVVKYTPRFYLIRPRALLLAVAGLMLIAATTTGFKSERIGDYSYTKDGGSATDIALWLGTLRRYQRVWQPRPAWQPGMD